MAAAAQTDWSQYEAKPGDEWSQYEQKAPPQSAALTIATGTPEEKLKATGTPPMPNPIGEATEKRRASEAALSKVAGYDTAPANEKEAEQRVWQTIERMGPLYTAPEMAAIPGPGEEAGTLIGQIGKGALGGAGIGALEHATGRAWRGELPDVKGTAEAAGTGALFGAVLNPVLHVPAVGRTLARIPIISKWMPEPQEAEEEFSPFKPSAGVKRSLGPRVSRAYSPEESAPYRPMRKPPTRVPVAPPTEEAAPEFVPFKPSAATAKNIKGYGSYDPFAEAGESGRVANPSAMRAARTKIGVAEPEGTERVAGTRSLVLSPEEASSEEQMQRVATKRARERGMQFAGGMTPREGRSVPRYPTKMAPVEYPGPRQVIKFPEDEEEEQ